jgi:hypothetical protein
MGPGRDSQEYDMSDWRGPVTPSRAPARAVIGMAVEATLSEGVLVIAQLGGARWAA